MGTLGYLYIGGPGARLIDTLYMTFITETKPTGGKGPDEIVSPDFTGGMRIASAMLRPDAVNFMDMMLRTDINLRVEEIAVTDDFRERAVSAIPCGREYLLVAIHEKDGQWNFNPVSGCGGRALIVLEREFSRSSSTGSKNRSNGSLPEESRL